jgi:hypothetical protein
MWARFRAIRLLKFNLVCQIRLRYVLDISVRYLSPAFSDTGIFVYDSMLVLFSFSPFLVSIRIRHF